MRRWLFDVMVTFRFFCALRSSKHARYADRCADAGAMVVTRALRALYPDAPFPYRIDLTYEHGRYVEPPHAS